MIITYNNGAKMPLSAYAKPLAEFQDLKYNNIDEWERLKREKVTDVGFHAFAKTFVSTSDKLIGKKTVNGIEIKGVSIHFVARIFGSVEENRQGVSVANIEKCLFEGQTQKVATDKYGRKSQQIQIDGVCSVSINPDTGQLVQVNPF